MNSNEIKVGDVMVFEGIVTRISKEDGKCFLRSKFGGNWFFMNGLKHKNEIVIDENVKEYICVLKDILDRTELRTRFDEYNPELAALQFAIDTLGNRH